MLAPGQLTMPGTPPPPKASLSQFDTPRVIAERMARWAGIGPGTTVLEPSAGLGALARAASALGASVKCIEIDPDRAAYLREDGFDVACRDYLECEWSAGIVQRDVCLMNPPFEDGQDLAHVLHALSHDHGRVVALLPLGMLDGVDRQERLWSKHTLSRLAVLVRRFRAAGTEMSGQRPFGVFEILCGKVSPAQQSIEWWS